jgi:hypothetical protein
MAQPSPLLRGIRALLTCDSGEVVAGIVGFVVAQNRGLRLLSRGMRDPGGAATAVIVANAIRCFVGVYVAGAGRTIAVARRPNERKAIEHLKRLEPRREFADLVVGWRPGSILHAVTTRMGSLGRDCRRAARLARALTRRYGVFRALRAVELVAYYQRYYHLLAEGRFQLAVMSSHSNPHGVALNLAARRLRIPIVLITHGMPIRPIARLDYDLAIHECQASRRVYEEAGCLMDHVVVKSRRCDHAPMHLPLPAQGLTAGVFLSKDGVADRVLSSVRTLLADAAVQRVIVRPHPVNLWRGLERSIGSLHDPRVCVRSSASLPDDLARCDLVVAGNSTVLLDAVVAGRPACYLRGLDHGPYDVQDFVKDGLVYEWDGVSAVDRAAVARFYQHDAWPRTLRRYADVDRGESDVAAEVRAALDGVGGVAFGAVA